MVAVLNFREDSDSQVQPDDVSQSTAHAHPSKSDPPPGRKMSREEAMDFVFKKNEELYRRLA